MLVVISRVSLVLLSGGIFNQNSQIDILSSHFIVQVIQNLPIANLLNNGMKTIELQIVCAKQNIILSLDVGYFVWHT